MSDEQKPTNEGGESVASYLSEDRFKNYQAEVARKLENTNSQLAQVLEALKTKNPSPEATGKKVSVFEDEDAYAARIKQEAAAEIEAKLNAKQQAQQKYQTVVQQIYSEFPEVSDESGPLMTRAKEIYAKLPEDERSSALAMKAAVAEAAAELGVRPKSKRSSDDSFQMGGSSSSPRRSQTREPELSPEMLEFAAKIGKDVSDPKYIESLKKTAQRKNWRKYE